MTTQVIILCALGAIAVPLGTFVTIKKFSGHTPINTLRRNHDIELQDVNHIQSNLRDIDISSIPEYPTSQLLINQMPIRWDIYPPPRFDHLSGNTATRNTPPGYSQIRESYINSPLENIINYDFIFWLILFILIYIIIIIILNYKIELIFPSNLENKIRTFLFNNKYFLKRAKEQNVNLENFNLRKTIIKNINSVLIRIILVGLLILYLLYWYNIFYSYYVMSISIPFSYFEVDFRNSFEWELKSYRDKHKISYLRIQTLTEDIIKILNSLKDDENYSMSLSFISSYKEWKYNKEIVYPLLKDNAIIINKESDPLLITQFIMKRLNDEGDFVTDWLFNDSSINSMDPAILTVIMSINIKF